MECRRQASGTTSGAAPALPSRAAPRAGPVGSGGLRVCAAAAPYHDQRRRHRNRLRRNTPTVSQRRRHCEVASVARRAARRSERRHAGPRSAQAVAGRSIPRSPPAALADRRSRRQRDGDQHHDRSRWHRDRQLRRYGVEHHGQRRRADGLIAARRAARRSSGGTRDHQRTAAATMAPRSAAARSSITAWPAARRSAAARRWWIRRHGERHDGVQWRHARRPFRRPGRRGGIGLTTTVLRSMDRPA